MEWCKREECSRLLLCQGLHVCNREVESQEKSIPEQINEWLK